MTERCARVLVTLFGLGMLLDLERWVAVRKAKEGR